MLSDRLKFILGLLFGIFTVFLLFYVNRNSNLNEKLVAEIEETFPEQVQKLKDSYGLYQWNKDSKTPLVLNAARPTVILIHGVDDPGKVWMNLAPELDLKNVNVLKMRYPNDQDIRLSAEFFLQELKKLSAQDIKIISIVAHSMGGLVSREMLTSPNLKYKSLSDSGEIPKVDKLIMVGTPNHGSELAKFRVFAELREQFVHLFNNNGHILSGIIDGTGQAKEDLLPGSEFLQSLNSRPQIESVEMLVIAGVVSFWDESFMSRLEKFNQGSSFSLPEKSISKLEEIARSMRNGVGDGLVTVESAQLKGVRFSIVEANHLSMIRNVTASSTRNPPAIPLIMDFLEL